MDANEIIRALKEAGGRVGGPHGAAARLGLKRTTFITRMKKLGIDPSTALSTNEAEADNESSDNRNHDFVGFSVLQKHTDKEFIMN